MSASDKDRSADVNATPVQPSDSDVWDNRKKNNVRLGWLVGAVVMAIFFLAIWRLRIT